MSVNILKRRFSSANEIWKSGGLVGLWRHVKLIFRRNVEKRRYQKWLNKNGALTDVDRTAIRNKIRRFEYGHLISIILPVYNIEEKWLRHAVESVRDQLYENWELCIADDFSTEPHIRPMLERYAAEDSRIKVVFRPENGHISRASNSALELATGDFSALLDHDDELAEDALYRVVNELNEFPECDMIYSDEDMIDEKNRRYAPKFKPDWSRDFFYSLNLITHLSVYRTEILRKIGGFRAGLDGSQDYDLALRVTEQIPENRIRHIPRILYHWRAIRGSVALSAEAKPYAHERAREAVRQHLERTGSKADVVEAVYKFHRVRYQLPPDPPRVTVIAHGRTPSRLILRKLTDYANYEITINSRPSGASSSLAADLNRLAFEADCDVLVFVESTLRPLSPHWLDELVSFAYQPKIGAVGAKLISRRGLVVHRGFILGAGDGVANADYSLPREAPGSIMRNILIANYSAVSVSCLAIRRELFKEVGGFDAENLPNRFFDVDLCLKLWQKDLRVVVTPYAELAKTDRVRLNCEGAPTKQEGAYLARKWPDYIEQDPFYNPNLSKKDGSFSIGV